MAIFYDDFEELVETAVTRHISRDESLIPADLDWEIANLTATLAERLRYRGVNILPKPAVDAARHVLTRRTLAKRGILTTGRTIEPANGNNDER